jgi:hypothetical protein
VAAHWFWANLAMGMSYFIIDWCSRFSGADYDFASTVQGWAEFTILLWVLLILYRAATPLRSCLEFPSNMKTFTFNRMLISLLLVNIALFVAIGAAVRFLK